MSVRYVALIVLAGVVGSLLYAHGVPSWGIYVVRHLIRGLGS